MSGAGLNTPLLDTIEPDEPSEAPHPQPKATTHKPVVLTPKNSAAEQFAPTSSDAESGAYHICLGGSQLFLTPVWVRPQVSPES